MKKLMALLMAVMTVLALVACGEKPETNTAQSTQESATSAEESITTDVADSDFPDGDPAEYSREYWEEKYPGENVCPFYIDENGTERNYYWVSGMDGWDGTIESWISQPFNWNGWHKTEDGCIVNEDESLKITDNFANGEDTLSSNCVVTTETYDKNSVNETKTDEVKNNVPDELSFKTQDDLACVDNFVFSALYVGTDEDKSEENDGLFFDFYNEDALYYVLTGFNEDDGAINHIWGYVRLYHFYSDEETYRAALESVPSYNLKEQNDECLYFTTGNVRDVEAESYAELMDMFTNKTTDGGEFDNFTPFKG